MYLQHLNNARYLRKLRVAGIARYAGVSRAAVSKWFQTSADWANVETKTIITLAERLGVSPDLFLKPCARLDRFQTRFLWDRLYPDMESFVDALNRDQLPAIARLVQVAGFHEASLVIGERAATLFDRYKRHIKPARRRQLEILWPLYRST